MGKQLAKYGHLGHLGGFITDYVKGKKLIRCEKDGIWLILVFHDGHRARIGWQDTSGNQLKGEPFIENMDVTIQIAGASLTPVAGKPGG